MQEAQGDALMVGRNVSCEAGGSCWSCAGQKVVECLVGADKPITNLWAAGNCKGRGTQRRGTNRRKSKVEVCRCLRVVYVSKSKPSAGLWYLEIERQNSFASSSVRSRLPA